MLKAGEKPPEKKDGDKPGRESGWIDLERVKVSVEPASEWRQMFREAWRLQREQFWTEDLSGIDWDAVHQLYLPLVDRITTRSEFSDLLWELQGELGTSHAYEMGGEYRRGPDYRQGYLGVDWEFDSDSNALSRRPNRARGRLGTGRDLAADRAGRQRAGRRRGAGDQRPAGWAECNARASGW